MATPTLFGIAMALVLTIAGARAAAGEDFASERQRMVDDIAALARETRAEVGKPAFDERVMTVMARVPRHEFVPAEPGVLVPTATGPCRSATARRSRSPTSLR